MASTATSRVEALTAKDPNAVRDIITTHAYISGIRAGAATGAVAAAAVLLATHYSPAFRARVGTSGKTGLVVMPFLAVFGVLSDKRLLAGARNPELYLASLDPNYVDTKIDANKQLRLHHRLANFLYDHPYRALVSVGAPLVGGIYAYQHTNKAISASQQIMHTRIYGQGAVVLLLLSAMGFHDYMHKHGRFEVADDSTSSAQQ